MIGRLTQFMVALATVASLIVAPVYAQAQESQQSTQQQGTSQEPAAQQQNTPASYDKAQVVTAGKLKSTDGIYGIRFAHNTEGTVSGFKMTRP